MPFSCSKVMKAYSDETRLWTIGLQTPRYPTRLVIYSHRHVPSACSWVLASFHVAENPVSADLNRHMESHGSRFERSTEVTEKQILRLLINFPSVEQIDLTIISGLS